MTTANKIILQQVRSGTASLARLLAGLLVLCLSSSALAGVTARLDHDKVYEGDSITLIIESDGRQSDEPYLTPLNKDFRILENSTSSQVSIINGRRSEKTSWIVQLEPRHLGKIQVPAIRIGNEKTRPLDLEVTRVPEQSAKQQSGHLFLEVGTAHDGVAYVQQQIPYTVRFYFDDLVLNGELAAPQPEHAVVEQLGEDKRYTTRRDGRSYNVIERHYVISPEKSGPLHIPPVTFKGRLASSQGSTGYQSPHDRIMDRFFRNTPFSNAPFFSSMPFAGTGKTVRIHSKAITVEVQPRPARAGNNWLPAEQLTLQDSWIDNPPEFRVGEPVTRTITLQAKGLSGAQIPSLQLIPPEQTRLYPETPVNESRTDGDKVYAVSQQTFTYIPGKTGKLTIPAFELGWWNTRTNQAAVSRLPKWEFTVEPGTGGSQAPAVEEPGNGAWLSVEEAGNPEPEQQPKNRLGRLGISSPWLLAAGVPLLLMIGLFMVKKFRYSGSAATPATKQAEPARKNTGLVIKKLLPQLEQACNTNDATAAAHTLLELGRARWPEDPPRNLGTLATRLGQGYEQIMTLDHSLYAANASTWEGTDLWLLVKDAWHAGAAGKRQSDDGLQPLYPQSTG